MADDDVLGMLDGPKSLYYAPAFRNALQATMAEYHVISNPVKQQKQVQILNILHGHHDCAETYRSVFGKKSAEETEEEKNKRWVTFNDTLRKMILGTYIGAKLPGYFRKDFNLIQCLQWKSFFIQRILVYHNHLRSKDKHKFDPILGTLDPTRKVKAQSVDYFKSITLPAAVLAQPAVHALPAAAPPPPPPPPEQPPPADA